MRDWCWFGTEIGRPLFCFKILGFLVHLAKLSKRTALQKRRRVAEGAVELIDLVFCLFCSACQFCQ